MVNKTFKYKVNLVPLQIDNQKQDTFRDELNAIPYLLYEVEQVTTGEKIVINKPGGKRSYGRLSRNDFMVFIYNPTDESLWLISHKEIKDDLYSKYGNDADTTLLLIRALYYVCCGKEPDEVIKKFSLTDTVGISVDILLKTYKWIWGQEDCNYPKGQGRWLSMDGLLKEFNLTKENFEEWL